MQTAKRQNVQPAAELVTAVKGEEWGGFALPWATRAVPEREAKVTILPAGRKN